MRIKRTYNLSAETVAAVKRLVEIERVAPTQDAVVERAVAELSRQVRDAHDARQWGEAARDEALQQELLLIDAGLPAADLAAWE